MPDDSTGRLKPFAAWSAPAFVGAGAAWIGTIVAATAAASPGWAIPGWLVPAFFLAGLLAAQVGLLGLYPRVSDPAPRLALAGTGITANAAGLLVLAAVWEASAAATSLTGPPFTVGMLMFLSTALGFLAFGLAGIRAGAPSRTVGALLVVPALALPGTILVQRLAGLRRIAGIPLNMLPLLVAGLALAAVGFLLAIRSGGPDDAGSVPDPAAE